MGLRYFEDFVKRNFNEDEHQEINIPYVTLSWFPHLRVDALTDKPDS
jgi:hypothetical protein